MNKRWIALALLTVFLYGSCKRNGTGGDATVVVFMKHHGNIIKNHYGYPDTVFVKYKSTDFPGADPSKYNTYFVGEEGEDHIHCKNLLPGSYYFYGVGMDSTGPYRVTGGMAIKIRWTQRKKEIDTDLAVAE